MATRRNRTELEAILDELVTWGFMEVRPGPPRAWRSTALGQQEHRFLQRPDEEPGFLAVWMAACDRRYHEELLKTLEGQAPRKSVDQATARVRAWMEANARELYPLAKAGDVGAFYCAFVRFTEGDDD